MSSRPLSSSDCLTGTEYASVDDKGRLFISQEKRIALGNNFYIAYDCIGCLLLFSEHIGLKIIQALSGGDFNLDMYLEPRVKHLQRELVGTMEYTRAESGGRTVIPRYLREEAGIKEGTKTEVKVIGLGFYAEIWEKGRHDAYRKLSIEEQGQGSLETLMKESAKVRALILDRTAAIPEFGGQ